jgi:hypothetical protein
MTDQTPLTAVLHAAARNSDKLLAAELAPLGLTGTNLELLAAYAETPGSSITDAGRACNLTVQSASTATLVSKGWVTAGIRRLRGTADALAEEANAGSANRPPEEDPRFAQVGNTAAGLYYRALMWADARKANSIPVSVVRKWSSPQAGVANRLIDAGLWKGGGDSYRIR